MRAPLLALVLLGCSSAPKMEPVDVKALTTIDQLSVMAYGHAVAADAGMLQLEVKGIHCAADGIERRRKLPRQDAGAIGCLTPQ
jgi:hypothetical protein